MPLSPSSTLRRLFGLSLLLTSATSALAAGPANDNQATIDYWSRETAKLAAMPVGLWTRVDNHTIKFEGPIGNEAGGKSDVDRLNDVLRPGDDTFILNSTGGVVGMGLAMALRLAPLNMRSVVVGQCFSSCANYLFTAGRDKEIRFGYVGYHGDLTALLAQNWSETAQELANSGMSAAAIAKVHDAWVATSLIEQAYLKERGISQEMFDQAQRRDKGSTDGKNYFGLLPGRVTFARFGIRGVSGQQDADVCRMHDPGSTDTWFFCPP